MTAPPPPPPQPKVPPGWYPDPSGAPGRQRYFDGQQWTERYASSTGAILPPPGQVVAPASTGSNPMSDRAVWLMIVAGGVFLLIVVVMVAVASGGGDKDEPERARGGTTSAPTAPRSASAPTSEQPTGEVAAPAGSTVRDGKFEFQVLGIDRSATKEGIFNPEEAKGEFYIVTLRVTNIGDDARSFSASSQHLIVDGNKYDATVSISDDNWMEDINPGLSIEANVTFDIPPGATPEAIEVHDSAFSGGATLALG